MQNILFFFRFSEYLQAISFLPYYAQHSENFFFFLLFCILYMYKNFCLESGFHMLQLETSFRTQQKGGYPQ